MTVHIGRVTSRVTIIGRDAGLMEEVVDLVVERMHGDEPPTTDETVIRDRLTTESAS